MMNKIIVNFEIGRLKNRKIEAGINQKVVKDRKMSVIIDNVLRKYHGEREFKNRINLAQVEVFVNRPVEKDYQS